VIKIVLECIFMKASLQDHFGLYESNCCGTSFYSVAAKGRATHGKTEE